MQVSRTRANQTGSGFTLVDIAVAMVLLIFGAGAFTLTVLSTMRLAESNEETATADTALHEAAANLEGMAFVDIFAAYNTDTTDDPGFAPGEGFDVTGLTSTAMDPDGRVGVISFPTLSPGGVLQLREDVVDPGLGMPRDLNGDGAIDALDHSDDYVLLPVTLRIEWTGAIGDRFLELDLLLSE